MSKRTVKVYNEKTGAIREIPMPGLKAVEKDQMDYTSRCVGPCKCVTDMDGACVKGWPSRLSIFIMNV